MCEDRIVRRKLLEIRFSGCVKVYGIATGRELKSVDTNMLPSLAPHLLLTIVYCFHVKRSHGGQHISVHEHFI